MPERITGPRDDACQGLDRLHGRRPPFHRFLAADRLEAETATLPDENAHPVATDDPPGLVGEHECRRHRVERFVHRSAEAVDLRERRLLCVDRLRLSTGKVRPRHDPDLGQEGEEALLDLRWVRLVKDLEESGPLAVAFDRSRDEQEIGGIARHRLAVGPGQLRSRGDQHPLGAPEERFHQATMHLLVLG
jgi:hypothetical protein